MNRTALKAGVWYTVCNFIVKIASFLTMPIFTRLLNEYEIGSFSNILSWVSIITIVATFDLYASVSLARFDYRENLNDYIASILLLGTIISAAFYGIVIIFEDFFIDLFLVDRATLHLIFLYCLVYPALQMLQIRNRIFYFYKSSVALSLTSVFASLGASLLLVVFSDNKLWGRTIGYYGPMVIINIVVYAYLLLSSKKISTRYWKYAITISFPLIWHTLAGIVLSSSDRIMITHYCGADDNGLYSVAYSCAIVVNVLWMSMNEAWSPWAYQKMDEKDYLALKKASKPYIVFFGVIVCGFLVLAPEVILLVGGRKYVDAVYVIPPVMIGYVFQFVYSLYVNIEFYNKKQKYIALGTIIAATVNIILNMIFIPLYGYIAAAYTTLAGYIILFFIHFLIVKRMGKSYWYDSRFNFSFLGIALLGLPISLLLYSFPLIRYLLVGAFALFSFIMIIKNRKLIITSIQARSLQPLLKLIHIKGDNI